MPTTSANLVLFIKCVPISTWKGFSPVWTSWCRRSLELSINALPHSAQTCTRGPCVWRCLRIAELSRNSLLQPCIHMAHHVNTANEDLSAICIQFYRNKRLNSNICCIRTAYYTPYKADKNQNKNKYDSVSYLTHIRIHTVSASQWGITKIIFEQKNKQFYGICILSKNILCNV